MKIAVVTGKSLDFIAKGNCKGKGTNTKIFGINSPDMKELKKDIDSRLFFALNGVLEKRQMCPCKVLEFFVQKRVRTLWVNHFYDWS